MTNFMAVTGAQSSMFVKLLKFSSLHFSTYKQLFNELCHSCTAFTILLSM